MGAGQQPASRSPAFLTAGIAVAIAAVVTLLGVGYVQTRRAATLLVRGEAHLLMENVREILRPADEPSAELLQQALAACQADGLRYVCLMRPDGSVRLAAGEPLAGGPPLRRELRPGQIEEIGGGRLRTLGGYPPPRRRPPPPPRRAPRDDAPPPRDDAPPPRDPPPRDEPPPPRDPPPRDEPPRDEPPPRDDAPPRRPPPPRGAPPPPLPHLVIEFEPMMARRIERIADSTLLTGSLLVLALGALGFLAARLLRSREALTRSLAQDQHLRSLGEMSAVLAHEIRNPLASLKGNTQLLAEMLPDATRERVKADLVVSEAKRLEALTADLLSFVRAGGIERKPVDPVGLLREVADECGGGRVDVLATGAPTAWFLDRARLRQVLANVVDNAVQASPESARIEATVRVTAGALCFEVRDRGEGIPAGQEEAVFEPFRTGKVRGTGLGLAVARRIVSLHGGTITARNHPEGGAVLLISIPET